MAHNNFQTLPCEIGHLKTLISLDLSSNPLASIPIEISRLKYLKHLKLDSISFPHLPTDPSPPIPTLKELAARTIITHQIPVWNELCQDLKDYLLSSHSCSFCSGPYFESCVEKTRIVKRNDVDIHMVHRQCRVHWTSDIERLKLMFCPPTQIPHVQTQKKKMIRVASFGKTPVAKSALIPLSAVKSVPVLPRLPQAEKRSFFGREKELMKRHASSDSGVFMSYLIGSMESV